MSNTITTRLRIVAEGLMEAARGARNTRTELEGASDAADRLTRIVNRRNALNQNNQQPSTAPTSPSSAPPTNRQPTSHITPSASMVTGGISAMDLARQTQGIDGLLRLYAVFTANVYALGSAFYSLREAMDVSNMQKGLEILGVQQGKNLVGLSKRLIEVTDGTISLKEAMRATAQATSAGLSVANTEKLAKVARGAATALGRDMPDALSRLTRGITKLEPELLDELGLLVRADVAYKAYADSIHKTVRQLTAAEKVQAFYNAVIEQGTKKFSALEEATSNPFAKLAAATDNLKHSFLGLIASGLGPVVEFLSKSPTALIGVLTLLGRSIVRQGLPALAAWREGLADTVKQAQEKAALARRATVETMMSSVSATQEGRDLVAARNVADIKVRQSTGIVTGHIGTLAMDDRSAMSKALASDLDKVNRNTAEGIEKSKQLLALKKQEIVATRNAMGETLRQQQATGSLSAAERANSVSRIQGLNEELRLIKAVDAGIVKETADILEQKRAISALNRYTTPKRSIRTTEGRAIIEEQKQLAKATSMSIFKAAVEDVNIKGFAKTIQEMGSSIKTAFQAKEIGASRAAFTALFTTITTGGLAALSVLSALSAVISSVVMAFALFEIAYRGFGSGIKELEKASASIDALESSVDNVTRTLDTFRRTPIADINGIERLLSLAGAMRELGEAAKTAVADYKEAQIAINVDTIGGSITRLKEGVLSVFNMDTSSNLAKQLSLSIEKTIAALDVDSSSEEFKKKLLQILGPKVSMADLDKDLRGTLKAAIKESEKAGNDIASAIAKAEAEVGRQLTTRASKLDSFRESVEASKKAYTDLINSTANKDLMFQLGDAMQQLGVKMEGIYAKAAMTKNSIDDLSEANMDLLAAMQKLATDPESLAMFSRNTASGFINISQQIKAGIQELEYYKSAIQQTKEQISKVQSFDTSKTRGERTDRPKELESDINSTTVLIISSEAKLKALGENATQEQIDYLDNLRESLANFKKEYEDIKTPQRRALDSKLQQQENAKAEVVSKLDAVMIEGTKRFTAAQGEAFDRGASLISQSLGSAQEKAAIAISRAFSSAWLTGSRATEEETKNTLRELDIQERLINTNIDLVESQEKLRAELMVVARATEASRTEGKTPAQIAYDKAALLAANLYSKALNNRKIGFKQLEGGGANTLLGQKDYSEMYKEGELSDTVVNMFKQLMSSVLAQRTAGEASRAGIRAQKTAAEIAGSAKQKQEKASEATQRSTISVEEMTREIDKLYTIEQMLGTNTTTLADALRESYKKTLVERQSAELSEFDVKIKGSLGVSSTSAALAKAKKLSELSQEEQEKLPTKERQAISDYKNKVAKENLHVSELQAIATKDINKDLQNRIKLVDQEIERQKALQSLVEARRSSELEIRQAKLDQLSTYGVAPEIMAAKQYDLDKEKTYGTYASAAAAVGSDIQKETRLKNEKLEALKGVTGLSEEQRSIKEAEITKEYDRQIALLNTRIDLAGVEMDKSLALLDIRKQITDEQNKQNKATQGAQDIADSLNSISGKYSAGIGDTIKAYTKLNISSDKHEKSLKGLVVGSEEYNNQVNQNTKEEVAGYAELAGAAKSMFGKKTAAYKALAIVEKSMHIARLAMAAKDLFVDLFTTKKKIANTITGEVNKTATVVEGTAVREAVSIAADANMTTSAILSDQTQVASKAGSEVEKTALANAGFLSRAGTYAAEIYGSTIGQLGPIAGPVVATALVAAMFALFGGGGSKLPPKPTISSEQLQETQGSALTYAVDSNNKLVKQRSGTSGGAFGDDAAKVDAIASSLEVIKNNSIDGLDYDDRMLVSLQNMSNSLTNFVTSMYVSGGLQTGTSYGTQPSYSSASDGIGHFDRALKGDLLLGSIGFALGGVFGAAVGSVVGDIIGSLTSQKVTQTAEITKSGVQLKGTLQNLIDSTKQAAYLSKEVKTTVEKSNYRLGGLSLGFGGGTSTFTQTQTQELTDPVAEALKYTLEQSKNLFNVIGEKAGVTKEGIDKAFRTYDVDKYGTAYIDTLNLTSTEAIQALFEKVSEMLSDVGSDVFSAFKDYRKAGEDFLQTTIRVVDANEKVKKALEYTGTTKTIDTVSVGTDYLGKQKTFDTFAKSEAIIRAAGSLDEFTSKVKDFNSSFLTDQERLVILQKSLDSQFVKLGYSSKMTRTELKSLVQGFEVVDDTTSQTYVDLLNLAKDYDTVSQLMDNSTISDATSKLDSFISSMKDFAKQIHDFRSSLILSDSSLLTPEQKLVEAGSQFEDIFQKAMGGDADAMSKLTNSSQAYLDAAKSYYASSTQYTDIFKSVMDKLALAETSATQTVDKAQLQLDALKAHTLLLENIDAGIAKLAGITPIQAFAKGGYMTGLSLVGENGPELVDFDNPGRVYTAEQTQDMLARPAGVNFNAMVTELQQLRKEVEQLRKEQHKQTGDIIMSNYDANKQNSDEIAQAIVASDVDQTWSLRNRVVTR